MSSDEPLFLDVEDVIELHATQLPIYGGSAGLRDRGLLESAVAQPQATFGGEFVHDGLFAMARRTCSTSSTTTRSWMGTSGLGCSQPWSSSTSTGSASTILPKPSTT